MFCAVSCSFMHIFIFEIWFLLEFRSCNVSWNVWVARSARGGGFIEQLPEGVLEGVGTEFYPIRNGSLRVCSLVAGKHASIQIFIIMQQTLDFVLPTHL